jgi:hypothetical protein
MKLALHHPFKTVEELLLVGGQEFDPFAEAYAHCAFYHVGKHQENDFYDPVEKSLSAPEGEEDDEDDWEIRNQDQEDPQAD